MNREICVALIALCMYGINKYYYRDIAHSVFFKDYFNDVMCGIVFGAIVCMAFDYWFGREILFREYSILIVFAGIYWEYIAPLYLKYSISDVWDIAAYLMGGIILQLFLRKRGNHDEV